jgi:DNA invertase Pin-like site-specific DNA recombinase
MGRTLSCPKVAVAYVRVSTETQDLGPDAQRAAIDRWASAQGVRVAAVHEDHGVSGGATLEKRPGLLAALDALPAHGAGLLVVAKRDRLARDPIVAAMVEAAAQRVGARVVSAAGEGEGDDPSAILMRRLIDAFAEYERGVIRARTKAALAVKRGRGERTSGAAPFGYGFDASGRQLVVDAAEQSTLELIRAWHDEGVSLNGIASRLNAGGVAARGARWHASTIMRVLRREAA